MLAPSSSSPLPPPPSCSNPSGTKRNRRPTGTPDPDADVVSLSQKTLLASASHACDICNRVFRREQNLQMHRRRHKLPWVPARRARKRVFVCPEPGCLHHDAAHALGDLVGIKKHFRRKHSQIRQWACIKCSRDYAVHSDYKAHIRTCGTRGHSCPCGRVFSRVDKLIEHQDECNIDANLIAPMPMCWPSLTSSDRKANFLVPDESSSPINCVCPLNQELQLFPESNNNLPEPNPKLPPSIPRPTEDPLSTVKDDSLQQLRMAMQERAMAREARWQAEREFTKATLFRKRALAELDNAGMESKEMAKMISSVRRDITCGDCRH